MITLNLFNTIFKTKSFAISIDFINDINSFFEFLKIELFYIWR